MKSNKYINLSNGIFFVSLLFALYVLINIIIQKSKVSNGLCQVEENKELIIVAIIVLIIGTIISTILDKKKMR